MSAYAMSAYACSRADSWPGNRVYARIFSRGCSISYTSGCMALASAALPSSTNAFKVHIQVN